jgi:DUF4097 and DUF4098 domain-containing protein YvlB
MRSKKIWTIIVIVLIIGAILMGVGVVLGAKKHVYIDQDGIHSVDTSEKKATQKITQKKLENIKSIDISVVSQDINFIISDNFGFEINNENNSDITWKAENGVLEIDESQINFKKWRFFNIYLDIFGALRRDSYINVYIPKDSMLESVKIKNISGSFNISEVSSKDMSFTATSGKGKISDCKVENLSWKTISGKMEIYNSEINKSELKITSGKSTIENIKSEGFNLVSISGSVDLSGELLGKTDIQATSGNVEVMVKGKSQDYSKSLRAVSGKVLLDGNSVKDYKEVNRQKPTNEIEINVISGRVELDFAE